MRERINDMDPVKEQIAELTAEVRRSWVAKPQAVPPGEDFSLSWQWTTDQVIPPPKDETEIAHQAMLSKGYWFGALGIDSEGNPTR